MEETKTTVYKFDNKKTVNENIDALCEYYDLYDAIKKNIKIIAKYSFSKGFKANTIKK